MSKKKGIKNSSVKKNDENVIYIENLPELKEKMKMLLEEKKQNPSAVQDGEAGIVFKEGEPFMIIDNDYVPVEEAKIVLQERNVIKQILILEDLKNKLKK